MRAAAAATAIALLLGLCPLACRQAPAPAPPPPEEAAEEAQEALTMSGINLYLHDSRPTEGVKRKPRFWVHAREFRLLEEAVWEFEEARAVIYGAEADKEEIILESRRGRFEEDRGATLKEGVKAYIGAMTLELEDITWEKPAEAGRGEARSDHPVRVNDPAMQLEAGSLRLYPDEKRFELTDVSGQVRFGRETQ